MVFTGFGTGCGRRHDYSIFRTLQLPFSPVLNSLILSSLPPSCHLDELAQVFICTCGT
jgi:hypothetical protein